MADNYVHTTWTTFIDLSGVSSLSGSEIWTSLSYIFGILSAYWNTDASASNYLVVDAPITGLSSVTADSETSGYLAELTEGADWTSAALATKYAAYIHAGGNAAIIGYDFVPSGETVQRFGYSIGDVAGDPTTPVDNTPSLIAEDWYYSDDDAEGTHNNLLRSGPTTFGITCGMNNSIFSGGQLTGTNGWNNRFFQPYLGFKQLMRLYSLALYASGGISAGTGGPYPLEGYSATSALIPIATYASHYQNAYNNVDELIYYWDTVMTHLNWVSACFAAYDDHVPAYAACGAEIQLRFISAGSGSQNAVNAFIGTTGTGKFMFTGPDSYAAIRDFRQLTEVAGLRLQWDKDNVFVPLTAYNGLSAAIWDDSTKNTMLYLTKPLTAYDVVREIISGG